MEATQKVNEINQTPPQPNPRTEIQSGNNPTSFDDSSK